MSSSVVNNDPLLAGADLDPDPLLDGAGFGPRCLMLILNASTIDLQPVP
eukprot:CAMPEP_0178916920 /NCGR_PEP_ID=MMETSP0786-20121207/12936_1 /TAXON_ID=186022 /ORGANISM="Thalassionema frauenfeldii, Strain CCMP 1798" /LENGTH=48 /DNA_ID= /DNA_START= /DNA_END= /DNA_ORIENTATION=